MFKYAFSLIVMFSQFKALFICLILYLWLQTWGLTYLPCFASVISHKPCWCLWYMLGKQWQFSKACSQLKFGFWVGSHGVTPKKSSSPVYWAGSFMAGEGGLVEWAQVGWCEGGDAWDWGSESGWVHGYKVGQVCCALPEEALFLG